MNLQHPFRWLPIPVNGWSVLLALTATAVFGAVLFKMGLPLMNEDAPLGIVSFQLAGDLARSNAIMESWGQEGQNAATLGLWLDYPFLVVYSLSFSLGCVHLASRLFQRPGLLQEVGLTLSWMIFAGAAFDAVENYALGKVLMGSQSELWPAVAYWSAIPKFLIFIASAVYVVLGYASFGFKKIKGDGPG